VRNLLHAEIRPVHVPWYIAEYELPLHGSRRWNRQIAPAPSSARGANRRPQVPQDCRDLSQPRLTSIPTGKVNVTPAAEVGRRLKHDWGLKLRWYDGDQFLR
jgi:hypothetical protein